jgi:prepilin-type N-terminal cleavage/methylation domain-containing protein/prepilin-type processing-associated H-X9-DG protein
MQNHFLAYVNAFIRSVPNAVLDGMKPMAKSRTRCRHERDDRCRSGFSLIELVVVIGIVGLLASLTLSAVQQSRETSRRIACTSNLKQLGLAVQMYEATHRVLPPGNVDGYSTLVFLLPFLDQTALYDQLDVGKRLPSPTSPAALSSPADQVQLPVLTCPSDSEVGPERRPAATNYAMNYGTGVQKFGYNGLFRSWHRNPQLQWGPIRVADVQDGLSNTAAFAEIMAGTSAPTRLRAVWSLPSQLTQPSQYDTFASMCSTLASVTGSLPDFRGRPWAVGEIYRTAYTHILGPNQPNCLNGNSVPAGNYSAGSQHAAGANVLFADGHVVFISNAISVDVWRSFGSVAGAD